MWKFLDYVLSDMLKNDVSVPMISISSHYVIDISIGFLIENPFRSLNIKLLMLGGTPEHHECVFVH